MPIPANHKRIFDIISDSVEDSRSGTGKDIRCYLVGGYVRDHLTGKASKDIDCVCSFLDEFIPFLERDLDKKKIKYKKATYETFGTVLMKFLGEEIEFIIPRRESYRDYTSRNPTISIGTFEDDVYRRDFTVNTLKMSLNKEDFLQVIDMTGKGLADLESKVLDTPVDPKITFDEDPLRMMRAARFIAVKDFSPAKRVVESCRENAKRLEIIVPERIQEEMNKSIEARNYFRVLDDLGLLEVIFPEIKPLRDFMQETKYHAYTVLEHTMRVVECLPARLKYAGLYHDTGKVIYFTTGNFHNHETLSHKLAVNRFSKMRFPNKEIQNIAYIVKNHMRIVNLAFSNHVNSRSIRRFIHEHGEHVNDLIEFARCDKMATGVNVEEGIAIIDAFSRRIRETSISEPVATLLDISGIDIMNTLGIKAGEKIGMIKKDLMEKVVDNELPNNALALLEYVKRTYGK